MEIDDLLIERPRVQIYGLPFPGTLSERQLINHCIFDTLKIEEITEET